MSHADDESDALAEEDEEEDEEEEGDGAEEGGGAGRGPRRGGGRGEAASSDDPQAEEWGSDWEPPWEDDFDEEAEEEYMEDVWSGSDEDWLPPGERLPKRRKALPKLTTRRPRRRKPLAEAEGDERDEFDIDAEEEVDVERPEAYCPLDRSSFGGEAVEMPPPGAPVDPALLPRAEDPLEGAWGDLAGCPVPGEVGFNAFAVSRMRAAGVGANSARHEPAASESCPPLQPHQEVVAFLMHRGSPIRRLLVDHPTGSGKTREMIHILNGFFHDPRPKVPIFPKRPVVNNFYVELLRWPSRYRDYYCCICPGGAVLASGHPEWRRRRHDFWDLAALAEVQVRELARSCREVLEMKGVYSDGQLNPVARKAFEEYHPGELFPAAPLRALGYASAGGANTRLDDAGRPQSAFFKIGHPRNWANVYDSKVVFMDEAHNLIRTQSQYSRQLTNLRELLLTAEDLVLAGFTGTPILGDASEARCLLDVIKGHAKAQACDEGFLSCLSEKPRPLFPLCLPGGVPDAALSQALLKQLCCRTPLCGEALQNYVLRTQVPGITERRLAAYCNTYAPAQCYHEGPRGVKANLLGSALSCAPKLQVVAEEVVQQRQKSLVLVSRACGYRAMLDLARQAGAAARPPFEVASLEQLNEFNAPENVGGGRLLCLVADAAQCSEGVSFRGVRVLHLVDVPVSPTLFAQQCGRANRMFGHAGLPPSEQTVTVRLHVAAIPDWAREPLGAWCLRLFCRRFAAGADTERSSKRLLGRLRKAGVRDLADLKRRADAHGVALAKRRRAQRGTSEVERRGGRARAAHLGPGHVAELVRGLGLAEEAASLQSLAAEVARARACGRSRQQHWRRPPLLKGLQELYHAEAQDAAACLCTTTVDEAMLQALAQQSRAVASALATLRACAVDRDLYAGSSAAAGSDRTTERPVLRRPSASSPAGVAGAAGAAAASRGAAAAEGAAGASRAASGGAAAAEAAPRGGAAPGAGVRAAAAAGATAAAAGAGGPRPEATGAKRRRLRSKGPAAAPAAAAPARAAAVPEVAPARAAGAPAARGGASGEAPRLRELRAWAVGALKREIARLDPSASLAGAVEKEDLCQLVVELSRRPGRLTPPASAAPASAAPASAAPGRPGECQGPARRRGPAAPSAAPPAEGPARSAAAGPPGGGSPAGQRRGGGASSAATAAEDLSSWSVGALKDILARVRPDLDLAAVTDKEELCALLRPWL